MASYLELREQFANDQLRNKVTVAAVIAAYNLLSGTPTDAEKTFAREVLDAPEKMGGLITKAVLAANKDATVAQINAASDAAIQTNVDSVIPNLAGA